MYEFYYAQNTCALASHIALLDADAQFSVHRLSIDNKEHHTDEYLALNPKARVPTLVTPGGKLTETPAILTYISQQFPNSKLAPLTNPFAFAKLQEFMSYISSTLHISHSHRMRGHRWVDDDASILAMQKKVPENVAASYKYIEDIYLSGPFVFGQKYSIADPYLFTFAQWMEEDGVNPKVFPKVEAHRKMMKEKLTVKQALEAQFA